LYKKNKAEDIVDNMVT